MISRLKKCVFAALPLAGLFFTAPYVVFAQSHNQRCWEQGDSRRSDDVDELCSEEASAERSRAGQRPSADDRYGAGKPYDDRSSYSLPDILSSNASPSGLDTSALLPVLLGLLLSGH